MSAPTPTAPGLVIPAAIQDQFKALKLRRAHKYLIIAISEAMELFVEKAGGPKATADDMFENLPPSDCRFALFQ
jgi:hypothetical protein